MVFKNKTLVICLFICGLGIVESKCFAMQYRTAAQEAERKKRYWHDEFNVHAQLNDRATDIAWLTKFRKTLTNYDFTTDAQLDAIIDGRQPSSSVPTKQPAVKPVPEASKKSKPLADRPKQVEQPKPVEQPKAIEQPKTPSPASSPSSDEDCKQNMRNQLEEVAAARAAEYHKKLMQGLVEAENNADAVKGLAWLQENRQALLSMNPALAEEIDEYIAAFKLSLPDSAPQDQAPQSHNGDPIDVSDQSSSTASSDSEEDREVLKTYHALAKNDIEQASTEQQAARIIVRLYKDITANYGDNYKKYYEVLEQLLPEISLAALNAQLDGLQTIPEINAIVGDEIGMLRGHMLFRVWQNPKNITPDIALGAFQQAFQANDINASINLFRDFLSTSDHKDSIIADIVMAKFQENLIDRNADALFDLYHHFIKNSTSKDAALILLETCIRDGLMPAEKWGVMALCFVGSPYADEIIPMIAKQLRVHPPIYFKELPGLAERYEEYRTSVINGDADNAIKLARELAGCVIDRAELDTIIASIRAAQNV